MERFFGFDLGDAESAVTRLKNDPSAIPEVLSVRDAKSFITAYARLVNQDILIGESACYTAEAIERKIRFKSRFLVDRDCERDIKSFAAGVLGELIRNGDYIQGEDCSMYIGCPAGWDAQTRERYRYIFEQIGYPPVKIISESRAALVSACQSKHLQVGYDILSHPVLVVDIGSSTTDFAYISGGKEAPLHTAGEVFLGGGIMDELLLDCSLETSKDGKRLREVFAESPSWRSYCEFAARRLKEKYFSDESYWKDNPCVKTVQVYYDKPLKLVLKMDASVADRILHKKTDRLNGRSFKEVFIESLRETRRHINGDMPDLIFMTGGVSKLAEIRDWCREVYPEAVIITEIQPEFSVAKGLALGGRIDEELRLFRKELQDLIDSSVIERIVYENVDGLYMRAVDSMTGPILKEVMLPVIHRWRDGKIKRLSDIDSELQKDIEAFLHTDEAKQLLVEPVQQWLRPVAYEVEEHTVPICVNHNVPYKALSLSSYLALSDIDIHLDTKNVFNVEEMTLLIDTIVALIIGLLCGGSGVALIAEGFIGIIAGFVITSLVLILGKNRMQKAIMDLDIPRPIRKLVPKRYFEEHLDQLKDEIRASFYESFEKEKNEEISERLVREISDQIEECLTNMARVVEIPLG